ncbi:MAG TPA: anti-sigma factor [Candidatus Limnocylindrales bacterium]|nr:anti-sigma factor [Candidatus Limnocylindrales bacterium]
MDHAEAREILELAAVEPDGIARLMAGDTPEAGRLAGHLAGCDECTAEMMRLRREAGILRGVLRTTPPPDLKERTLALVREVGRDRSAVASAARAGATAATAGAPASAATANAATARPGTAGAGTADAATAPVVPPAVAARPPSSRRRVAWGQLAAIAAAVVVAVLGTTLVVGGQRDAEIRAHARAVAELADVATSTIRVASKPDAAHVALAATGGSGATGTIIFSKADRELVVTAAGLKQPDAGHEFRCWVEIAGRREVVGRMFFGGGLAYWVGPVRALGDVPPGASFGVSLVDLASPSTPGEPYLAGRL